jgi:hypothetical protein
MGMFDPNAGKFDLDKAERVLGIDEELRNQIRLGVAIDLLLAHAGITDEQVQSAYIERIKNDLGDTIDSLKELAGEESGD